MDKQTTNILLPAVAGGIIILAVVGFFAFRPASSPPTPSNPSVINPTSTPKASAYKDGTYKATGNYVSPGGPRDVDINLTLKDGIVTGSTFAGHATDPNSMRFQGEFKDGYKQFVVGKNIDEISITKVSGSSLTPKGFNDALEKIKTEAQV